MTPAKPNRWHASTRVQNKKAPRAQRLIIVSSSLIPCRLMRYYPILQFILSPRSGANNSVLYVDHIGTN